MWWEWVYSCLHYPQTSIKLSEDKMTKKNNLHFHINLSKMLKYCFIQFISKGIIQISWWPEHIYFSSAKWSVIHIIWFLFLIFLGEKKWFCNQGLFFIVIIQIQMEPDLRAENGSCRQKMCPLRLTIEVKKYRTQQDAKYWEWSQLLFGVQLFLHAHSQSPTTIGPTYTFICLGHALRFTITSQQDMANRIWQ